MKKIITYTLLVLSFFCWTGCGDQLDVEPANSIDEATALKTSADVEALLVGAYDALSDVDVYGGNIQMDAELLGDNGELFWDGTFVAPGEIFAKSMLITNDQAQLTWLDSYRTINICNTVLANLATVTSDRIERVEGEARFIRAIVYFELVRSYAKTWTDGNPASNPGVPLVTVPTTAQNYAAVVTRNSVAEVYDFVIDDLTKAETLLPESNGFFGTTYAASAILSRVYLMQNDYAAAAEAASKVIESGEYDLADSYADAFNKGSQEGGNATPEDVFSIQINSQDGINDMNTFFASSDYGGRGDIYIEAAHFELYEENDDRLNLFYDDERTGKWNNQFGNVNIVRLAEMYLTRAEANFREGTTIGDEPLNDINLIRARVNLDPLDDVTLDDILLERHLELAFEGHLIHDIKRTQSNVGDLPYNAPELIFPIPLRELNINPTLGQNDGY
jgi:starch-binding outer membrane protein, SusD/RagB family